MTATSAATATGSGRGDRTVVITGSTRGIGRGMAGEFLKAGCNVVITGRSSGSVDAAVAEIDAGSRALGVAVDVRDPASLQSLWDATVAEFGAVDIWINNAGISHERKPLWELTADEIADVVETNVLGTMHGMRIPITEMQAQGHGAVYVFEGFGSDGQTQDGLSVYGASKRSVAYLRKALVKDLGKDSKVRVGAISPGIVATDLLTSDYEPGSAEWDKVKKIFNILGDRVETVTPWLVEQVLADTKQGSRIAWLTKPKAAGRFAMAWRTKDRDIFA